MLKAVCPLTEKNLGVFPLQFNEDIFVVGMDSTACSKYLVLCFSNGSLSIYSTEKDSVISTIGLHSKEITAFSYIGN